jgi:DNA-binding NarL/FixJ family response regulator
MYYSPATARKPLGRIYDFINKESDMIVVGTSSSKAELMEVLSNSKIDILLLDMNLTGDYQI